ncbi:anthranilate synthase component I family protein [Flavobacterium sp. RHBU_3]|uniref:anthranilate synthase component I family protein n=1 Tax=Flavobacterium sp. RHBU_3 TaxID=3391184 RepID=UPI00398463A0
MKIYTQQYTFNADLYTPVGLYLGLRNHYRKPCLLEGNDYHSRTDSTSFVGLNPIVEITVFNDRIVKDINNATSTEAISNPKQVTAQLKGILNSFEFDAIHNHNSFLSYFSFEYAHFEESVSGAKSSANTLPLAQFILFEYLIVLDHFHDTGTIFRNSFSEDVLPDSAFEALLRRQTFTLLPFETKGTETSVDTDADFLNLVEKAKEHIYRGDVFQLVVSRPFEQPFFGDDFQVYRQLRRLNPSPYLFYADMESYRLMGSSPETQIGLQNGNAAIHPIAGTVRKTGNAAADQLSTEALLNDEKENAEHTMLVDLARNDLSRFCDNVHIASYKEVQHFSHVIHLVSKVAGEMRSDDASLDLFAGTFPAGTLSGTPKPKALELISRYESTPRDYYGGAIGFINPNGNVNLAIVIRSIFSQNNTLHYRAGAGVVIDSKPENELQEVNNKLGAVRRAIVAANKL